MYSIQIPAELCNYIIFNNGSDAAKTSDLAVGDMRVYIQRSGWSACASEHIWSNGSCTICGAAHSGHQWSNGTCGTCGYLCTHSWNDGVCLACQATCAHSSHNQDGKCTTCEMTVNHSLTKYADNADGTHSPVCDVCSYKNATEKADHSYTNGECVCGYQCTHEELVKYTNNGENHTASCACGEKKEEQDHSYTDHMCVCGAGQQVQYTIETYLAYVFEGYGLYSSEPSKTETRYGTFGETIKLTPEARPGYELDEPHENIDMKLEITLTGDPTEDVLKVYYCLGNITLNYNLTGDDNFYGSSSPTIGVLFGEDYIEKLESHLSINNKQPNKTGHTFTGWKAYTDIMCTQPYEGTTMPAQPLYVSAQFEPNTYNAIFDTSDGAWGEEKTKTVPTAYGATIVAPEAPVRTGYIFSGWDPELGTMGDEDVTFTAQWTACNHTDTTKLTYTYVDENGHSVTCACGTALDAADHNVSGGTCVCGGRVIYVDITELYCMIYDCHELYDVDRRNYVDITNISDDMGYTVVRPDLTGYVRWNCDTSMIHSVNSQIPADKNCMKILKDSDGENWYIGMSIPVMTTPSRTANAPTARCPAPTKHGPTGRTEAAAAPFAAGSAPTSATNTQSASAQSAKKS